MATLTTGILTSNSFVVDSSGVYYERTVDIDGTPTVLSFGVYGASFFITMNDNAYPLVDTVEDANTRLDSLGTGIVLA